MRSYFKILVVSSLEPFPTQTILMTSLVTANNRESSTIRQSLTENDSEWLNCLAETAVILLPKTPGYSISNWHQKLKGNSLSQVSNFTSAAVL